MPRMLLLVTSPYSIIRDLVARRLSSSEPSGCGELKMMTCWAKVTEEAANRSSAGSGSFQGPREGSQESLQSLRGSEEAAGSRGEGALSLACLFGEFMLK